MAIVDTVWDRLARFNAADHKAGRGAGNAPYATGAATALHGLCRVWVTLISGLSVAAALFASSSLWLAQRILKLLWLLARFMWLRGLPATGRTSAQAGAYCWRRLPEWIATFRWGIIACCLVLVGWAASVEMRTSHLEARLFSRLDRGMDFAAAVGPSPTIDFPQSGPYDDRLGYTRLRDFTKALLTQRYAIDTQAQWSPGLTRFVQLGAFPIYKQKDTAGLRIYDRTGNEIYGVQFPEWVYPNFTNVPPLVANSLAFIEDRYLLDTQNPERNPAIEWKRFALAAAGRVAGLVVPGIHAGGGSTLATQIEKFRHSYDGRTRGVGAKLRQMLTASAAAYTGGPDTLPRRREILTTYLNATPLGSMPGYGEIIGVPEALRIWFGTDYQQATALLDSAPRTAAELARKGEVYRQVLSLLLSERRPSYYLVRNHQALARLTDKYLVWLNEAGVIDAPLRDAALAAQLHFRDAPPPLNAVSYVREKATEDVRDKLVSMLKLPDLYSLDRLDLSVETSVDTAAQARITSVLQRLSDPQFVRANGMVGKQLLGGGDLSKVTWSFVLYEHDGDRNSVRVHADSLNKPFDINSGAKLQLGSTAKLRTLVTYLDIISVLHDHFASLPPRELSRIAANAPDPLTGWAAGYLARTHDHSLQGMLDAAMQRTYSAEPGEFFTGGGMQSFGNFESTENGGNPTVEVAFQHSINLSFIRLMRDVISYYTAASGVQEKQLLGDPADPQRQAFLQRFVEADSRHFLNRFYKDYRGLSGNDALALLAQRTRPVATRLATVFLSVHPDARLAQFQAFLTAHLPKLVITEDELWNLFLTYSPQRLNLADRGYVSGVHPLELWLVRYLQEHPGASWDQVLADSGQVRHDVYSWLFKGDLAKQDDRIRILLEQDAFGHMLENWRAVGYPFAHLVPSLGTVIGASGDRPDALAQLMGIIMNDGVRVPTVTIDRLKFAQHTPYETDFSPAGQPERVMPVEVARTLRRALTGVVEDGTASRLRGTYTAADGSPLPVGGKTGTGDNRFDRFARGGGLISSRVVDRTATFVFFLGNRFYGTVTAYVPGPDAEHFDFSSALAVQLLKVLEPELKPLIDQPGTAQPLVGSSQPR